MKRYFSYVLVAILLLATTAVKADSISLKLGSGDDIPIQRYPASGDTLILWTPSIFGVQPTMQQLAVELGFDDLEVWVADLHTGFFVSTGRNSVEQFKPELLVELIDLALKKSGKRKVLLMSTGSGAKPVLRAARAWQTNHPGNPALAGMVLFHPSLYAGRPALGESARYLSVVEETNLPIFIIQPTLSTTRFRVNELQQKLRKGGSQVYLRIVEGARDGYHVRPDDHLGEADRKAKAELSTLVSQAANLLLRTPAPRQAASSKPGPKTVSDTSPGLRAYPNTVTPPLELKGLDGSKHRLQDYRGKVVLVSFWASWCPPCIKEMPSMNALQKKLKDRPFVILGVNIGERKSDIKAFLKKTRVDFQILLDEDRQAYNDWKVYVVPSNFVVDAEGRIRMGTVGAIDWEAKEATGKIIQLLEEPGAK